MVKGQRVRLSARGVRVHFKTGGAPYRKHVVDWNARRGTIVKINRHKIARVHWDGNRHMSEALPLHLFEPVEDE